MGEDGLISSLEMISTFIFVSRGEPVNFSYWSKDKACVLKAGLASYRPAKSIKLIYIYIYETNSFFTIEKEKHVL